MTFDSKLIMACLMYLSGHQLASQAGMSLLPWGTRNGSGEYPQGLSGGVENCQFLAYSNAFLQFLSFILVTRASFPAFFEVPSACFGGTRSESKEYHSVFCGIVEL